MDDMTLHYGAAKLLIVDDDPIIVDELSEYLGACGYACQVSHSAEHAIELFQQDPAIGIVLSDLHMPGLDGLQLIQELERLSAGERIFEAVIFTGQSESSDVIAAMRAGIADYHQKPIDLEEVLLTIKRLERHRNERLQDAQRLDQLNQKLQLLSESLGELHHDIHQMRNRCSQPPAKASEAVLEREIPSNFNQLSPRQLDVARLIGKGMTNYQISCELGITENTVKLYVSQVLRLTHMHNRTQLALALSPNRQHSDSRFVH
ncbi:MAG: DNA-binding response regulator [Pseudomonadaceae bacterium]|uniref:response regulator transcription factor n=1 Tax=Pseudomonas sp. TaxID=306 RepID=UPI000C5EFB67|nr:response regulator transcription factor [Pseudomonas sp.]MAC00012.1 DNA-binding response regulator [Pseudomonadaceae bacterium]